MTNQKERDHDANEVQLQHFMTPLDQLIELGEDGGGSRFDSIALPDSLFYAGDRRRGLSVHRRAHGCGQPTLYRTLIAAAAMGAVMTKLQFTPTC